MQCDCVFKFRALQLGEIVLDLQRLLRKETSGINFNPLALIRSRRKIQFQECRTSSIEIKAYCRPGSLSPRTTTPGAILTVA